jgi:nicotinamidase/pyrazinamidase
MSVYTPSFFKPSEQIGKVYRPDIASAIAEGRRAGWSPAALDGSKPGSKKICLILIDEQIDFVHTDGALSVPGSLADVRRVCELLYHEGHRITTVVPTIDTHSPFMIFFPTWWVDDSGQNVQPFTIITHDDIKSGKYRAVIDPAWSHAYVDKLASAGKQSLMIWPFHCLDVSEGFSMVPALYEAVMFHASARFSQPVVIHKGHIPQTEFYSPFQPEVEVTSVAGGTINTPILTQIANHDEIWIAGEAKSHCVLCGMESLVSFFGTSDPNILKKIYFLMDCTSSVQSPLVDFEAIASKRLQDMASQYGINLCKSTDLYR